MPAIRNFCVARGVAPQNSDTHVYVVPTANSLICKSIALWNQGTVQAPYYLSVISADQATRVVFAADSMNSGSSVVWNGWIVLNEHDILEISLGPAAATYWVSGAILPFG